MSEAQRSTRIEATSSSAVRCVTMAPSPASSFAPTESVTLSTIGSATGTLAMTRQSDISRISPSSCPRTTTW